MSQMSAPPPVRPRPTVGQLLDARLDAMSHLADRIATLAATLAVQSTELADMKQTVAHLQRRVGRFP